MVRMSRLSLISLLLASSLGLASAVHAATDSAPASPPSSSKAARNLAPGFTALARGEKMVIMPIDVELASLSAGGLPEPKADWTAAAQEHLRSALLSMQSNIMPSASLMSEREADEFAEQVSLHAAVARSISLHHGMLDSFALPTKEKQLRWNLGDAMQALQSKTNARYGLFIWMRDSYASAERKAAMVAMAMLGVGLTGGMQTGYASLVDLKTGDVLWFNQLSRMSGDLREAAPARETLNQLLMNFPPLQ